MRKESNDKAVSVYRWSYGWNAHGEIGAFTGSSGSFVTPFVPDAGMTASTF